MENFAPDKRYLVSLNNARRGLERARQCHPEAPQLPHRRIASVETDLTLFLTCLAMVYRGNFFTVEGLQPRCIFH